MKKLPVKFKLLFCAFLVGLALLVLLMPRPESVPFKAKSHEAVRVTKDQDTSVEELLKAIPEAGRNYTPLPDNPLPLKMPEQIPQNWRRNAAPYRNRTQPKIVIVLDDMGLDVKNTRRAMELPGPLTLSFLPYADNLPRQTGFARARGHELMLHMPMQPIGRENPGPNALTTGLNDEEIKNRVEAALRKFEGAVGLNNHMGSRFTQDEERMKIVTHVLKEHGLLFLDSKTIGSSKAYAAARETGIPALERDVFLDDDMSSANVTRQLFLLERIARRRGYAIAIGHPHPNTIAALQNWLPYLEEKGLQLAPISAVVKQE